MLRFVYESVNFWYVLAFVVPFVCLCPGIVGDVVDFIYDIWLCIRKRKTEPET